MGEFTSHLLQRTPLWVWGVLLMLITLGVRQLKPRVVKRQTVLIAPTVFLVIGLMGAGRNLMGFSIWMLMLVCTAVVTFFFWQPQQRIRLDRGSDKLLLPGSLIPLFLMLTIFLLNYAINVIFTRHPELKNSFFWQVGPGFLLGSLSGIFMGRAATLFFLKYKNSISLAV
ncbi:MAG: hypothetical protein K1X48_00650 [Burkholderiaceae bacterium]|nr:hypothetical protein [Burkholderiaceae bacterium]